MARAWSIREVGNGPERIMKICLKRKRLKRKRLKNKRLKHKRLKHKRLKHKRLHTWSMPDQTVRVSRLMESN